MHDDSSIFSPHDRPDSHALSVRESHDVPEMHGVKSVVVSLAPGAHIDTSTVAFPYYNSFNYALLTGEHRDVRLVVGVTSPNRGEGKTLVASNLAVSLAMGYRKKTVVIDLNVQQPRLHEVFGLALSPGLTEALENGTIHVSSTQVEGLCVLTAGACQDRHVMEQTLSDSAVASLQTTEEPAFGLEQLSAFLDVLYSLEQEFEFVVVDMPAINTGNFPILFASRLNGLIVVVDTRKTSRQELDKMFRQVNQHQVLGFVFNRVRDDTL